MIAEFTTELASVPDRESLVAEVWVGDVQICELAFENGALTCIVFPQAHGLGGLDEMIAAAEHRLRERYDIAQTIRLKVVNEVSA